MKKNILVMAVAVAMTAGAVSADSITGGTEVFGMPSLAGSPSGSPYWNNVSQDSAALGGALNGQANVGYFLSGQGAFSANTSYTAPDGAGSTTTNYTSTNFNPAGYFAGEGGAAPTNLGFVSEGTLLQITLLGAFGWNGFSNAGDNFNSEVFGYYLMSNPSNLIPLFNSNHQTIGDEIGTTINVSPTGDYGFYIQTTTCNFVWQNGCYRGTASHTYFMNSTLDTGEDQTHQHFAVFAANSLLPKQESYYLGIEDGGSGGPEGMGDFQDLVFKIVDPDVPTPPAATPEPGTLSIAGLGLIALALTGRKSRK